MKTQHGTVLKVSGSWVGRYSRWVTDANSGEKKRVQKSYVIAAVKDMGKTEARQKLRERIEQETGLRSDGRVTLAWFIDHRWQPLHEGQWRESTKATNLWVLGTITSKLGDTTLEDADPVEIQQWLNGLAKTHSGSLVKHCRTFLKSIFDEACEQDYVRKSPARLLRIPADLKHVAKPFLTQEQIAKLLKATTGMDKIILRLLLVTGLRPSELFALEWSAFDRAKKLLHITQSLYRGKLRHYTKTTDSDSRQELQVVFLPDALVAELEIWRGESLKAIGRELLGNVPEGGDIEALKKSYLEGSCIFPSDLGVFWWKENYQQRVLNPLVCKAFHTGKCFATGNHCTGKNIPLVNFQVLRRTVATHAQSMGSPKDIAAVLRHSKPDTAAIHYTQQQDASVRSTVEQLAAMLG